MDRGVRGAPAAAILLLLLVGIGLHRAEVVHFGPLILKVDENVTKNSSLPENVDLFPVTVSSEKTVPSETIGLQLLDSVFTIEAAQTTWPLSPEATRQDDLILIPGLSTQTFPLLSTTQGLQDSMTTQLPETHDVRSDVVGSSSRVYVATSLVPLETGVHQESHQSRGMMEDSIERMTSPPPESFSSINQISWTTQTFPLSGGYGEVVTSSFTVESTKSGQPSTDDRFGPSIEDSLVASNTAEASPTHWPVTPVGSTYMPSIIVTPEVTSVATKYPLYSIFTNVGLFTMQGFTTSPTEALPTTSLYETSYIDVPELVESPLTSILESTFNLLQSSVPAAVSETMYIMTTEAMITEVTYTQWWSEDYSETMSFETSDFLGELPSTSVIADQKVSTVEVVDSVSSFLPIPAVSSRYTDLTDSSLDFTNSFDSREVQATSASPSQSSEMETHWFSSVESTLMPSMSVSLMPSVDLESSFSSTAISTPFLLDSSTYEPVNTVEAPAFVPIESGMYFTQTTSPPVESTEMFAVDSSYFSLVPTPEPSELFTSLVEEFSSSPSLVSSHVSAFEPQDSSTLLAVSQSILSSSMLESYSTFILETIGMEATPWVTLNSAALSSFTPSSSIDWTEISSYISSEMWEVTSTIVSSSILYTSSTFTGATSLLPLLSSPALNATTSALATSPFGYDLASSAWTEEVLPTSLLTLMTLPPESNASRVYTSLFSLTTLIPPSLTPAPSMPPTSAISLPFTGSFTSTVDVPATSGQPSINPASTVSVPTSSSSQATLSLVFPPVTPPTPDVHPSPTQPVTTSMPSSSTPAAVTPRTPHVTTQQVTTTNLVTPGATSGTSTLSAPVTPPSGLTAATTLTATTLTTTRPSFVCDVSNPEPYLVTVVLSRGSKIENVTELIKETLTVHFNRSVELEVYSMLDTYSFMVTSGPVVYTAIAVGHVLSRSRLVTRRFAPILSLETASTGLELRFHVQTVLQFVPQSVDIRLCTFSERIHKGLTMALYEVRRLRQENENFTVQIVNISSSAPHVGYWKAPVTVSYAVRERRGLLNGSEVSDQLRNLSLVEFSFFLGFPVKQIAEPFTYPQLNVSPLLKDSWLRTILLGVLEPHLRDDAFQMEMERKLAQLIGEATLQKRRWKRASNAGSNTVQVVNVSRLDGQDDPVQLVYFIEDQYGGRLAADKASNLINEVNIQRAAIILGYRLQGVVAQPLNQPPESDRQAQNLWIIVGVAVPVLVVTVIIVILYWKLCRTDKLDFQPDTISNLQQRQKLQAPNVKGFDFAKQHLGQHNKDEVLMVHEPPPPVLHGPLKDSTPSENGDIPTPRSKCSTKPHKVGRHRSSRVTPSDAGSTASDPSSGKESEEGSVRPSAPPRETKLRPTEMPVLSSGADQHSSASIFEHVDRMSRSSEASRRLPSKIQLIAMQPMVAPPMHGLSAAEREVEANKVNREIQTTLRHKSEIEHHRNKIRLRAKRKGHYEFPLVDVVGLADTKERQRMYRRAQMQFDKILDPVLGIPTVFIEPRKSSRARRSPKQRRKQQGSSSPPDADRDRLIATDSDGTYKRPPGVSNSAYVSDPDIPSDTPVSDLGKFPGSPPPRLPAQYVAPQPSIEEVRQTMQSLLDDAFALVAPSSQGPGALPSGNAQHLGNGSSARNGQGSAAWRGQYPPHQSAHYNRFADFGASQSSAPCLLTR